MLRSQGRSLIRSTAYAENDAHRLKCAFRVSRSAARPKVRLMTGLLLFVLSISGCQSVGPLSLQDARSSRTGYDLDSAETSEIEVINERCSSHVTCRPRTFREEFKQDAVEFWPMVGQDAMQMATASNAAILGVALGGALIIRDDLDGQVRESTAEHPRRWGKTSEFVGYLGNAEAQVPVLLAIHATSLMNEDEELRSFSKAMLSAYAINGLSTVAIKGIANTDRPSDTWNNGEYGFPSFHASSSTAIAAVLDEYYGPTAGVPAYALAGLISWSRIDQRDHDLSDVVFGAAMGYVIGKTVARNHLSDDSSVIVLPSVDPGSGSFELLVEVPF